MGYDIYTLPGYTVHVSSHNSEQDEKDREAVERFEQEVRYLIDADPDYRRVIFA